MLYVILKYMKINLLLYLKFDKLCCIFCFIIYLIGYIYIIFFLILIGIYVYNYEEFYLCLFLLLFSSDFGFVCKVLFSFCFKMYIFNIIWKKWVKVIVNVNVIYYIFIVFC